MSLEAGYVGLSAAHRSSGPRLDGGQFLGCPFSKSPTPKGPSTQIEKYVPKPYGPCLGCPLMIRDLPPRVQILE